MHHAMLKCFYEQFRNFIMHFADSIIQNVHPRLTSTLLWHHALLAIETSHILGKSGANNFKNKFNLTGVNKLSAEKQDIGLHVIIWFN